VLEFEAACYRLLEIICREKAAMAAALAKFSQQTDEEKAQQLIDGCG
jgi:hypothetical protein